jgi:hypothetical protein
MDGRGWGWTNSQIRHARLLEWLAHAGDEVQVEPFYRDLPDWLGNDDWLGDVKALGELGLIEHRYPLSGVVASVTPAGQDRVDIMLAMRADVRKRRAACRDAMVAWLCWCDATSAQPARRKLRDAMVTEARFGLWFADAFTDDDLADAAAWLHRHELVQGLTVAEFDGPVQLYLTDEGIECAENFDSETGRYLQAQRARSGSGPIVHAVASHNACHVPDTGAGAEHVEPLSDEQRQIVDLIYGRFVQEGKWPTFSEIDRPSRKAGLNPVTIIRSISACVLRAAPSGRRDLSPSDELQLTLQGIIACGGDDDVERFLGLLPWLAARELDYEPGPGRHQQSLKVTSAEIRDFLGLGDSGTELSRLFQILKAERWGYEAVDEGADGGEGAIWPSREVSRFASVRTLDQYLGAQAIWNDELEAELLPSGGNRQDSLRTDQETMSAEAPAAAGTAVDATYVSDGLITVLKAKSASSKWDCDKLFRLITELNDNYMARNVYASHAVLRAILDHVPPILGCRNFDEVVNSIPWGRTDKAYMKHLLASRNQADDALHRQISTKPDVLRPEDMPSAAALNRLLQECADRL